MAKSNFIVRGGADFSGITREMDKTENRFKGFEGKINKTFSGIAGGMGLNLGKFTKLALIGVAARELYNFGKASIEVASDLKEVQNVVDVTFGNMSNEVNNFAGNALKQFGLSELSAKKFTSTMGAMLKSSGLSGKAAKNMSIEMTKLSADMASFYNLDAEGAFTKIQSGLSGETEPLKRLGINMSVANMEAYAMAQGIKKAWKEMNQAEQTMLRYNYLLSVTGDAQGDFARTSGSWANQVKLLKEQWQEFMGLIGKALMEILLPIVKGLNKMLEFLIKITKEIGKIYTMITGKQVEVQSTATTAADGEENLADGIDKAGKAAKKALAPFDELNIIQNNLDKNSGLGGLNLDNLGGKSGLNTTMSTKTVDSGPDKSKWEGFFIWFGDKWRGLKQTLEMPITVPTPVFAALPNPVWKPNYGLEGVPAFVPAPAFEPLPNPIWQPNWNIAESLQMATDLGLQKLNAFKTNFSFGMSELVTSVSVSANTLREDVVTSTQLMFINTSIIFSSMKNNAIENMKVMKETLVTNAQEMQIGVASALAGMATSAASSIYQMANSSISNMNSMFSSTYSNLASWVNNTNMTLANWGNGMIQTTADTANGMVASFVSGLKTMWDKFKEFAKATGEKIKGSFSGSFSVSQPEFINPIGVGIGALTLLKGMLSMPKIGFGGALATGGITNGPMMALIGDNSGGKEVVSPLDDLLDMITTAVSSASGGSQGSGGDMYLTIKIGEDTFVDKVVNGINRQNRINGKTVITV